MANNFNIVPEARFNTIDANMTIIDTVVDAIRAIDVINIRSDIAGIALLTDEEKSLMGLGPITGLRDDFNLQADGADPDASIWTVIENGGTVNIVNNTAGQPGYVECDSGGVTGQDALAITQDKYVMSLKNGITTLHLRAYLNMNWAGEAGAEIEFGVMENETTPAAVGSIGASGLGSAGVGAIGGIPYVMSADDVANEQTDVSAFVSDATGFWFEMVLGAASFLFYIDDTLRATHTTRYPLSVWQIITGATCINNNASNIKIEGLKVWAA